MKRITLLVLMALALVNCDDKKKSDVETKSNGTEKIATPIKDKIKKKQAEEKEAKLSERTKTSFNNSEIDRAISNFKNCKAGSTKRSDCRNSLTRFISEKYNLNDFKDEDGEYYIYDSIQPIVKRSSNWRRVGTALSQDNINTAVSAAENGSLVLVIDTSQHYGHVVIVQPGELTQSSSWGLKMPPVISLSNYKPSKSFYSKALSYAFKKSNDLEIYIRE